MAAVDRFVTDILEDQGKLMLRRQGAEIAAKLKSHTGRLQAERSISVSGNQLTFTHVAYERFLDMKRLNMGGKEVRNKRKIHNRFTYGAYSRIAERLLAGASDNITESINDPRWQR